MKKREAYIIAALAALCAIAILLFSLAPKGSIAAVYYDGEEVERIRLDRDAVYYVGGELPVTLEVEGGRIRFVGSQCPDLLCEGFGWIGEEHEYAICMPAKIVVMIQAA